MSTPSSVPAVRFVSYNIGCSELDASGVNRFSYNKTLSNIRQLNPQVLAIQDCSQGAFDHLQQDLQGFTGLYQEHPHSPSESGVALFYHNGTIRGHDSLAEEEMEKASDGTAINRSAMSAILTTRDCHYLHVVNCDLFEDGSKSAIEKEHADAVKEFAAKQASKAGQLYGSFTVVCGGINHDQDHEVFKVFIDSLFRSDGNRSPSEPAQKRRSDFILRRSNTPDLQFLSKQVDAKGMHADAGQHQPVVTDFVACHHINGHYRTSIGPDLMQSPAVQRSIHTCTDRDEESGVDDITALQKLYGNESDVHATNRKVLADVIDHALRSPTYRWAESQLKKIMMDLASKRSNLEQSIALAEAAWGVIHVGKAGFGSRESADEWERDHLSHIKKRLANAIEYKLQYYNTTCLGRIMKFFLKLFCMWNGGETRSIRAAEDFLLKWDSNQPIVKITNPMAPNCGKYKQRRDFPNRQIDWSNFYNYTPIHPREIV